MVQKYGKLIYGWDYSKDLIKPLLEKLDKDDEVLEWMKPIPCER